MNRILRTAFILALIALSPLSAIAGSVEEPLPSADLEAIFAAPAVGSDAAEASWANADVSDTVFQICCRGALAVCTASCGGNVSSFTCTPAGSGCSSSCRCG